MSLCVCGLKIICVFSLVALVLYLLFIFRYLIVRDDEAQLILKQKYIMLNTEPPVLKTKERKIAPRKPPLKIQISDIYIGFELVFDEEHPYVDEESIQGYKVRMWKVENITRDYKWKGRTRQTDYPSSRKEWDQAEKQPPEEFIIPYDKIIIGMDDNRIIILTNTQKEYRGYEFDLKSYSKAGDGPNCEKPFRVVHKPDRD